MESYANILGGIELRLIVDGPQIPHKVSVFNHGESKFFSSMLGSNPGFQIGSKVSLGQTLSVWVWIHTCSHFFVFYASDSSYNSNELIKTPVKIYNFNKRKSPAASMSKVTINKVQLQDLVRNRDELLFAFEHIHQYYLPPENFLTNKYLGMVLRGEKLLFKLDKLSSYWVPPQSPYLTVSDIYAELKTKIPKIESYMPLLSEGTPPPRKYFFRSKLEGSNR